MRSKGSGEAGVYIRSLDNYFQPIRIDKIAEIATSICKKYDTPWVPNFEILPPARRRWGCYYYERQLITLNLPTKFGNFLHELAHHINRCRHGRYVESHGFEFKNILNMLFDEYHV